MRFSFFFLIIIISFSCSNEKESVNINTTVDDISKWIVDDNDIKGGGKTYELSINPQFGKVSDFLELSDHEKVALISFNNEIRVYPYFFTNYYEVINDIFDDKNIAVTYCPLTKSGICFNRDIDNKTYEILASGYLYKDNMIPSDKNQEVLWSQMLMQVIGKNNSNKEIDNYNLIETTWKTVKEYYPNASIYYNDKRVASATTPVVSSNLNSEYIYGIFNHKVETEIELFQYSLFKSETELKNRVYNNRELIIIGSEQKHIITSYYTKDNLVFTLLEDSNFPNILKDNEDNIWNVFGYAISGNRQGEQLESPKAYVAQYWAWKDFYENLNLN